MFYKAFPGELKEYIDNVMAVLPKETVNDVCIVTSEQCVEYNLESCIVEVPYRMYLLDINEDVYNNLGELEKQILCCMYTRNSDGYIREKYLRKLLAMNFEKWVIPFIVKICDEYVVEMLEIIYKVLKDKDNSDIKNFCLMNKKQISKSYSRMISYWNEYYRGEEFEFRNYIGRSLFRECLGYDRTFEKE